MLFPILIGLGAGAVTAILYISATAGSLATGSFLLIIAPLPCFIAGLGWGWSAGAMAAAASAGMVASAFGGFAALDVLLTQTLPAAILSHLVMLGRPVDPDRGGSGGAADVEWYPIGRVVAAATLMAAGTGAWRIMNLGGGAETIKARLIEIFTRLFQSQFPGLDGRPLTPAQIDALASTITGILPVALAAMWLVTTLINLWLAARITRASARLNRPWPDIAAFTMPPGFSLGLAVAVVVSWLPGPTGYYGMSIAGAFLAAYTMLGLAVIHWNARASSWRSFILAGTYAALLVLSVWAALAIALIGLAEPFAPWSRARTPRAEPPDQA